MKTDEFMKPCPSLERHFSGSQTTIGRVARPEQDAKGVHALRVLLRARHPALLQS
jgi:hypothetical protein